MKLNKIDHKVLSHWADNYKSARRMLRARLKNDVREYKKHMSNYNLGPMSCEYCKLYYLPEEIPWYDECYECPIYLLNDVFYGCSNTPYMSIIPNRGTVIQDYSFEEVTIEILENIVIETGNEYLFLKKVFENNKKEGYGYE